MIIPIANKRVGRLLHGLFIRLVRCLAAVSTVDAADRVMQDLAAWYPLGPGVEDRSGNELHGQRYGCLPTEYRYLRRHSALELDAYASCVDLPSAETIFVLSPDACTVAGWFRTESLQSDGVTMASDYNSSGWDTRFVFHIAQFIDGRLHATIRKQHLSEWDCVSIDPVPLGEWHFFTFTVSKVSGVCRLYLDGELQQELAIETNVDYIENVPVHLGKSIFQSVDHVLYTGALDDVRFYRRDLAAEEIADLFEVSLISGLTAHYPLYCNAYYASGQALHGPPPPCQLRIRPVRRARSRRKLR